MTNWRGSVTATVGIDVKLHAISSLQNVTTTRLYRREKEKTVHTKRNDNAQIGKANTVMQRSPHL